MVVVTVGAVVLTSSCVCQGLGETTLHALLAKSEAECEQLHETKRNLMARVREVCS